MDSYTADRLNYKFMCGSDEEPDVERAYYSAVTVSQNIEGSSVHLHVPAIQNNFMDTSEFYIRVAVQVLRPDGGRIGKIGENAEEPGLDVFPLNGFLSNLWSQCNVRVNGCSLPPVTNYPYVAQLYNVLASSLDVRENVLQPLSLGITDGADESLISKDSVTRNIASMSRIEGSKEVVLYGRVHSDFLQSLAQLLPDSLDLDIELVRGRDSFALGSANPDADYRIRINSVTLFVIRVVFNSPALAFLRENLGTDDYYSSTNVTTVV